MARKTVEPSINAISTIILLVTAVLIYVADRLVRRDAGRREVRARDEAA
jgi:ABC-type spermidine/putrescine transport system permease subunit II